MNELTYTRCGDYYIPDLKLSEQPEAPIGKYGRMRQRYLKEHRPGLYSSLILNEKLYPHLLEIDRAARERMDAMLPRMMEAAGVTEDCLNPRRSASNVRYYTPADIEMIRVISYLLRNRGLKLEAAKEQMRHNRGNVSRRIRAIERLENVRDTLSSLLKSLNVRAQTLGIEDKENEL